MCLSRVVAGGGNCLLGSGFFCGGSIRVVLAKRGFVLKNRHSPVQQQQRYKSQFLHTAHGMLGYCTWNAWILHTRG